MNFKVGLMVDLGNSETRVKVMTGGKVHDLKFSNTFAKLPDNYRVPKDYVRRGGSTLFCVGTTWYANGRIVDQEFSESLIRPTSSRLKSVQMTTELSFHLIFAQVLLYLASVNNCTVDQCNVSYKIKVLLPPAEEDNAANTDRFINTVTGIKEIFVSVPQKFKAAVNITSVEVFPEGLMAFFGAFFEEKNGALNIRPENQKFREGNVLVLDIGAGTTDMVILQNCSLVVNSKMTFPIGGTFVGNLVRAYVKREYGIDLNAVNLQKAVSTCQLRISADDVVDVSDFVNRAKMDYAQKMLKNLREYAETSEIPLNNIFGLLVVGGGSLSAVYEGKELSAAMADILVDFVRELSPRIALLDTHGLDNRYLNLHGLWLMNQYQDEMEG